MTLLTPAFALAGVLLAAIPILIHILNRRRYREQRWAAMEFLLKALKKNRRRLRFEQWILLAVRCLVLALLGLALARPVGCNTAALSQLARQSALHVLVIDDSYSMAYEADRPDARTHLDQAKRIAAALIGRMTPGSDSVAIVTASAPARLVFPPGYDLEAARNTLDRIQQSYAATDLPNALRLASQTARESSTVATRELDLLTDATRSSLTGGASTQPPEKPTGTSESPPATGSLPPTATGLRDAARDAAAAFSRFTFHRLGLANQSHTAVLSLDADSTVLTTRQPQRFHAQLATFAPAGGSGGGTAPAEVLWRLDDQVLPNASVSPTGNAEVAQVKLARPGPRVLSLQIDSGGGGGTGNDRLKIDQSRRRVFDAVDRVRVLIVEGERGGGPLGSSAAFLRLALAPPQSAGSETPSPRTTTTASIFDPDVISDLELANKSLADYRAVILCGVPQIPDDTARQLQSFARIGGAVITFMGEGVSPENYNATMLPRGLIPGPLVKRVTITPPASPPPGTPAAPPHGVTFDFNPQGNLHPMLSVFKNEPRTGLDTAEVFTYWQVDLASPSSSTPPSTQPAAAPPRVDRVLDFAASHDPAITLSSIGQGKAVFIATSAGADGWTTLPAKPVFVTLVQEMLSTSLSPRDAWMNLTVGESLILPPWLTLTGNPALTDVNGNTASPGLGPLTSDNGLWHSAPLTRPGVYVLTGLSASTGQAPSLPIAVNVDANAEADIRTLDAPAISRALGDIPLEIADDQLPPQQQSTAEANAADYGWVLMLLLLAALTTESFLAMRFGHHGR
jgi:hypothetical protein